MCASLKSYKLRLSSPFVMLLERDSPVAHTHTFKQTRSMSSCSNSCSQQGLQNASTLSPQGPTPDNISDFWQMIWFHKPAVIVMLTKGQASGKLQLVYTQQNISCINSVQSPIVIHCYLYVTKPVKLYVGGFLVETEMA